MFAETVMTILLLSIAFVLGGIIGATLRSRFTGSKVIDEPQVAPVKEIPDQERAPSIPTPPKPLAPVTVEEKATLTVVSSTPLSAPLPAKNKSGGKQKTKQVKKPAAGPAKKQTAKTTKATSPATKKSAGKPQSNKKSQGKAKPSKPVDNLKLINGIGPKYESKLKELGVTSLAQIAKWTKKDQTKFGETLSFPGRIEKEEWVAQAKLLVKAKKKPAK